MKDEAIEVLWLEQHELSMAELADLSGAPALLLEQLLDCGAIAPLELPQGQDLRFGATALQVARKARRLQADFDLDMHALTLALALLERISDLESQIQVLRARIPRDPG